MPFRVPGETLMSQQVKRLVGDPLRRLQLLMGHRSRDTPAGPAAD